MSTLPVSVGHGGDRLRYRGVHGVEAGVERYPRGGRRRGGWRRTRATTSSAASAAARATHHLVHGSPSLVAQLLLATPLGTAIAEPDLQQPSAPGGSSHACPEIMSLEIFLNVRTSILRLRALSNSRSRVRSAEWLDKLCRFTMWVD